MDPMSIAALISAGSSVLKGLGSGPTSAPPPPQRADGYAMGGYADSSSPNNMSSGATGGATGGAYGGAWSQSTFDGSNWTVSTGKGSATGGGKSGAAPVFTPVQSTSQAGVSPASPFTFGTFGAAAAPAVAQQTASMGTLMVIAVVALLIWKR